MNPCLCVLQVVDPSASKAMRVRSNPVSAAVNYTPSPDRVYIFPTAGAIGGLTDFVDKVTD